MTHEGRRCGLLQAIDECLLYSRYETRVPLAEPLTHEEHRQPIPRRIHTQCGVREQTSTTPY